MKALPVDVVSCPQCGGTLEVQHTSPVVAGRTQSMRLRCVECGHRCELFLALTDVPAKATA